jgi:HSP20 family protein
MNLMKYNPMFGGKSDLSSIIDDFFNRSLPDVIGSDFVMSRPSVNVKDFENEYVIELAAPGLEKDNFDLKIEKDSLVISASKEDKKEESGDNYSRREFNFSSFSRRFALPENLNLDTIAATYDKGILTVRLPKTDHIKTENVRKIEIQ